MQHLIRFDDGKEQWVSLFIEKFELLKDQPKVQPTSQTND